MRTLCLGLGLTECVPQVDVSELAMLWDDNMIIQWDDNTAMEWDN